MFFRRQSQDGSQWVGVAHEGAMVCAAQVAQGGGERPRVQWLWQGQAQTLEQGLRALRTAKGLRGDALIGVLDRTQYRMQATEAPDVPRDDWRDAMRWQLKEQVDFPVEDAVIDVLEVPHSTQLRQNSAVMAFLIPRASFTVVELAADDVGLTWSALDVPETALRNLCALGEEREDDKDCAHALMVFGESHGMLVITLKGELLMARHIEVAVSAVTGTDESRGAALSRAALEILRTIDTFERMHSQVNLSGLTVALPHGCGPEVLEMLSELIYVPLKPLDLRNWFDLDALADEAERVGLNASFSELCALGATLRAQSGLATRQQLQLLDLNSVLGQSPTWGAVLGVRLLGGVVALGTVAGLGLSAAASAYDAKAQQAEADVGVLRVNAAANPPSPVVKQLDALRHKEAQQRQMQDALQGSMAWASQGYSDYLMALGRQTFPGVWITGMVIRGDGTDLVLSGRTSAPAALPAYLQRLGQEERFKGRRFGQIEIQEMPIESGLAAGVVQFTLRGLANSDYHQDKSGAKKK